MLDNFQNEFGGMFGKLAPDMCRLTVNGGIAVKCSNGYKTYNVKKGTLTNVTNFSFNIGDEMFFRIPTNKAEVGDIIIVNGRPKCVIEANKNVIKVIDYENSEIREVVPERHIFMGNTYFYAKIVSFFGNMFKSGKGPENIMKIMMLSQMMGGNANGSNGIGGMGQMMAMSMLMGSGNSNPFEGMFDLGIEMSEEDDESKNLEEEA